MSRPRSPPRLNFTGMVEPALNAFDRPIGERSPPNGQNTLYWTLFVVVLPATSAAETVNVLKPTVVVSRSAPLATVPTQEKSPASASAQPKSAFWTELRRYWSPITGFVMVITGDVVSMLNETLRSASTLPARSTERKTTV